MYNAYTGSTWILADAPYYWNGSAWKRGHPYYFDGLDWQNQDIIGEIQSTSVTTTFDVSGPSTPPPPPTQTYTVTKSWSMDWGQSYLGSGGQANYSGDYLHQGQSSYSPNGNMKSLAHFNVGSFPSGATCLSATVKLYAAHWYYNSGGTAVIGTHNKTSAPSTWTSSGVNDDRLRYDWNTKTGLRTITLGNTIGNEFISGTTEGLVFGPGPSTSYTYYGYFVKTGSYKPVLTIKYQYTA